MSFQWNYRGRTYVLTLGIDGTRRFAWRWRPIVLDKTLIYRLQPFSLAIIG